MPMRACAFALDIRETFANVSGDCHASRFVAAQTLTPVQNARFIVSSSPQFPDTVACALWIAALSGDPAAKQRLQAGPYQIRIG